MRRRRKHNVIMWAGLRIREVRPGYFMIDYRRHGASIRRCFSDLAAAKGYCDQKAVEIQNKGLEAALLPDGLRLDAVEAARLLGGASLTEAARFYLRHHRVPGGTLTVKALIEQYLAAPGKRGRNSAVTRRFHTIRVTTTRLKVFARTFSERAAHEVGQHEIEEWLNVMGWQGLTRRHYIATVRALYDFAMRRHIVEFNPALSIESPEIEKVPPVILSPDQVKALFSVAARREPSLVPVLALSFFCGLRPNEIAELNWEAVNLDDGMVTVRPSVAKMKRQRIVDIPSNARRWFEPCRAEGRIFKDSQQTYRRRLSNVLRDLNMSLPYNAGRHAFASYHMAVNPAEQTSKQLGHSSTELLYSTYRNLVTTKAAKEFWEIVPDEHALAVIRSRPASHSRPLRDKNSAEELVATAVPSTRARPKAPQVSLQGLKQSEEGKLCPNQREPPP